MNPDINLFNIIATVAMSAIGWIAKAQHHKLERIERELAEHKVKSVETFAAKADFLRLEGKIDRVLDKLDEKADKQ
jgi:hypothetical protein